VGLVPGRGLAGSHRRARRVHPHSHRLETADTTGEDLTHQILERSGGELLAGFLDSVGGAAVSAVLRALRPGATIVSYGVLDDAAVPVRNSDLIYRNLTWKGFGIDHCLATTSDRRERMASELWQLIRDDVVTLPVGAQHPLDEIKLAVTTAAANPPGVKVLVCPDRNGQ
jgi:NADPH:quinone reductase-like Zn-dependent oxidoreductase